MFRFSIAVSLLLSGLLTCICTADVLSDLTQWEEGRTMRSTSATKGPDGLPDPEQNGDRIRSVPPGASATILDVSGPGVITHIWITILQGPHPWGKEGIANHQEILIRMYWDGREKPDVEAPLGDFFGSCFGKYMEVISIPVLTEDADSFNCYWKMPFRKSARIEIINQSDEILNRLYYNIDWDKKKELPTDTLNFCARYRQEYPAVAGKDYLIADIEGRGYYVGTVLAVRTRSPSWFGEGDEKVYIDGEKKASIWGTGTEDYFLSAWGLKETSTPYFGVPYLNDKIRSVGQMTCSYRWHLWDRIVFSKSLKFTIETKGWLTSDENPERRSRPSYYGDREDDYSSVAFWYQQGPSKRFTDPTTAAQRKLPNLDRVIASGQEILKEGNHGPGKVCVSKANRRAMERTLYTPQDSDNGWAEIPFEVKDKEPLRLVLRILRQDNRGIYQPYLNGIKLMKPIDMYSLERTESEIPIMDFWPDPGKYTLRLECVGKNERSYGHVLGLNSVRLRQRRPRVKALGYDKDHDWRQEQIFYRRNKTRDTDRFSSKDP
jgi:D-arabinan exo alpha-(1,3)/(1,5)-arabinofuranosidase (non-reducing end)